MHPSLSNIGAYIKAGVLALEPAARGAGTTQGPAVDITRFKSLVLSVVVGASSGAPAGVSAAFSFESRVPDGAWAAVKDRDGSPITVAATAVSGAVELDLDLSMVGDDHEELRVVQVLSFTGGTAPTLLTGASLVLGGAARLPV
ncbi:hypothetical protein [Myxococcus landrumensis]|uniref:Uncharacterized protein n=1 Tax=Myxococcus landrumensis TaxID=2813577 RepID=A0ABX7NEH2_9BACT|nr:hypothetical protein [Myxococcus landrumus]QSQ17231.1 hypothetical protein JY572_14720 [Myxococcus landrumus]